MITHQQFAALLLRLFALWLLLNAAQIVLLTYAVQGTAGQSVGAAYAMAGLYAAAALVFWRFPMMLARAILRPAMEEGRPGDANGAAAVAFIGAGLLIIAFKALTPVANYCAMLAMLLLSGQGERLRVPGLHVDGVIGFVMLGIGVALIVRCRALARVARP